ncbi:FAD-binding oxidoreductase [Plantibacter sp. T3]|uniref:NAD(P)/FAD-dependent oxidoreductase n=1 Tax=Plantibacter sp. T3 TaxID=2653161 RepID=UPI0012F1D42F|nr:FAD-binding oxidoreductase [Plantibacter sp. T3]VXB39908.1 Glycine/D-amino acid oxidase [Plantibacter sp. T3]
MSTTTQTSRRVVVIGGGILGTSSAVALARRGADVTLVTDRALASGASGRSLAWLNSAAQRSSEYHALRVLGIDRWRTFAVQVPSADFLRFDGGLMWAPEGESYTETFAYERGIGYDARWLAPEEVASVTPGVDPAAVAAEGAIFNPGEGWVELPSVIEVLSREFVARGGRIVTDAGAEIASSGGRAVGAVLANGDRIEADAVLLATGPDVPAQLAALGITIGDQSPAAFVAFTKPVASELVAVLNTPKVAVRRTREGGFALDSAWSEEEIEVRDDGSLHISDSTVERLLAEGSRVLAGNPTLELDHIGAGYKPIPGDGEPVFGAVPQLPGLFTAFSHSGATLGLIAGELLADEIVDGEPSPLLATFRPERYAESPVPA